MKPEVNVLPDPAQSLSTHKPVCMSECMCWCVYVYLSVVCLFYCHCSPPLIPAAPPAASEPLWPPWKPHPSSAAVHGEDFMIKLCTLQYAFI